MQLEDVHRRTERKNAGAPRDDFCATKALVRATVTNTSIVL